MNKIDKTKLPCKYFTEWEENQSPIGSGYHWMEHFTECTHPEITDDPVKDAQLLACMEDQTKCSPQCVGYEPVPICICPKHGEYWDYCYDCQKEDYDEAEKLAHKELEN